MMSFLSKYRLFIFSLAYAIAVAVGAYFFAPSFGITEPSETLSLMQVVIDILVLLPAIVTFIIQVRELQSTTRLDLKWNIQVPFGFDKPSLEIPKHTSKVWSIQPILMNAGDAVAIWYIVSFYVPADLVYTLSDFDLSPITGNLDDNWKVTIVKENDEPKEYVFTFMSNGKFAAYPNYDLILASLRVRMYPNKDYRNKYDIRYVIATDKGPRKDGIYTLYTHKENLAKLMKPETYLALLLSCPIFGNDTKEKERQRNQTNSKS